MNKSNQSDSTRTIYRADYQPPVYLIDHVALEFDLDPKRTLVCATLTIRRNPSASIDQPAQLVLNGEDLEFISAQINGKPIAADALHADACTLTIDHVPDQATLCIRNAIAPDRNSELMGLYVSNKTLFTQCEAEGFRRITYFLDRPDIMSRYRVTLRAARDQFPVLLANGNLEAQGDLPERPGWHWTRWVDPHPKPCYLFALVAGNLVCQEDHIQTRSGREVLLQIWVAPNDLDKTEHALSCLKQAIRWDEQRWGLALDLDRFMIVASHDFNMGAMENKGLNIFNARYVLASADIATDDDYAQIESIVGHEYFHNWTGNRVTCRDWFQLSLKEGLTVFRDQEFSADQLRASVGTLNPSSTDLKAQWAAGVKRIEDVRTLRATQFPEDAGPQAHPVRPDSYQEIGNFYTATVYEKGAEVVRMMQTLLGRDGFRRGFDLYIKRHDGQAVTCDDFLQAMRDANQAELPFFERWYAQSGTPSVTVSTVYDAKAHTFDITLTQYTAPTPDQEDKHPLPIAFSLGLVLPDGSDAPLKQEGESQGSSGTRVLTITQPEEHFRFVDITQAPVPSLVREFSAPIVVNYSYSDADLVFLASHDSDPFNRWEAITRLATDRLLTAIDALEAGVEPQFDKALIDVFDHLLSDANMPHAFVQQAAQLPSENMLAERCAMIDPQAVRAAHQSVLRTLGCALAPRWQRMYHTLSSATPYRWSHQAAAQRGLRNLALAYWAYSGDTEALTQAHLQLETADNMTDRQAALTVLINSAAPDKAQLLLDCARRWSHEPLLMNKWFRMQATAIAHPGEPPVLTRVQTLTRHSAYTATNPNNVYALVLSFCAHNLAEFHREDGAGYIFWVEQVLTLDRINPTVAARVARTLDRWRKFAPEYQKKMQDALKQVASVQTLSRDVREIIGKALAH